MKQEWFVVHQVSELKYSQEFDRKMWESKLHEFVTPSRATKEEAEADFLAMGFPRTTHYVQCHDAISDGVWERYIVQCRTII